MRQFQKKEMLPGGSHKVPQSSRRTRPKVFSGQNHLLPSQRKRMKSVLHALEMGSSYMNEEHLMCLQQQVPGSLPIAREIEVKTVQLP